MICQELKCKKQESKKHMNTLCKFHAEKLERAMGFIDGTHIGNFGSDPLTYKTINKKNSVWEDGIEHTRAIRSSDIDRRITMKKIRKGIFEEMIVILKEQVATLDEKIEDDKKTKNSRYVKQ